MRLGSRVGLGVSWVGWVGWVRGGGGGEEAVGERWVGEGAVSGSQLESHC